MLKKVIYSLLLLSITDATAMGKWFRALSSREDQIEEMPEDDACPVTPTALTPNPQTFVNVPSPQKEIASQEEVTSEKGSLFFVHPSSIKARSQMHSRHPANMPQSQNLEALIRSKKIHQQAQESLYPTIAIQEDDKQPTSVNLVQEMLQNKKVTQPSPQLTLISDSTKKPNINYEERLKKIKFNLALKQFLAKNNNELFDTTYHNTDIIPASLKNLVYIKELPKTAKGINVLYMPADGNAEPPAFWFRLFLHNRIITAYQNEKNDQITATTTNSYTINDLPANMKTNRDDVLKLLQTIQVKLKEYGLPETIEFIKKTSPAEIVSDEQQNNVQQQASLKSEIAAPPVQLAAFQKKQIFPSQHLSTITSQQSSKKMLYFNEIVNTPQYGKFAKLIEDWYYLLTFIENNIIPGSHVYKGATSTDTAVLLYTSETYPFFLEITPQGIQKITYKDPEDVTTETISPKIMDNFIQSNNDDPLTLLVKEAFLAQENLASNQKKIAEIKKNNQIYQEIIFGYSTSLVFIESDKDDIKYKIATFDPLKDVVIETFESDDYNRGMFIERFSDILESNKKSKNEIAQIINNFTTQDIALRKKILNKRTQ